MFDAELLLACGWVPVRVVGDCAALLVAIVVSRDGVMTNETMRVPYPAGAVLRMISGGERPSH